MHRHALLNQPQLISCEAEPLDFYYSHLFCVIFAVQCCVFHEEKKKLPTCFARHSHHAFLLLPEADVVLERQEVEQELKKEIKQNVCFILHSDLFSYSIY